MDKKLRILFVSHDSTFTGAPILLLNLLQLLKEDDSIYFEIVLYRGGELENEFKKIAPVTILKGKFYGSEKSVLKRFRNFVDYRLKVRLLKNKLQGYNVIFSNTVANGRLLKLLQVKSIPIISFVHELETVICQYRKDSQLTFKFSRVIAYPSIQVRNNLVRRHGLEKEMLLPLYCYFPIDSKMRRYINKEKIKEEWRARFGLSTDKFLIVSMGTATYRKGIDLFVEVAYALRAQKDICFVWIGDFIDEATESRVKKQIKEYQLKENFFITGFQAPSIDALLPFDLFLLTSREDPYPLVAIEAAFNRLPVLAFSSGGIEDFVQGQCGWLVDNFLTANMVDKILELKNAPDELEKTGQNAFSKAIEMHANKRSTIHQLKSIFQKAVL